jgi:hypothetical protein
VDRIGKGGAASGEPGGGGAPPGRGRNISSSGRRLDRCDCEDVCLGYKMNRAGQPNGLPDAWAGPNFF